LSPRYFTPSTVVSNEESGSNTKLLRLSVSPEVIAASDPSGFQSIWSVFIKDDDIQVERPYTPLYGLDEHGHMLFWIKKYPKGEVGRWLHTKTPGEKIEFRAPLSTWNWKNDTWDEVVFVSRYFFPCRVMPECSTYASLDFRGYRICSILPALPFSHFRPLNIPYDSIHPAAFFKDTRRTSTTLTSNTFDRVRGKTSRTTEGQPFR
jgi:hypothetical protein